jgi:transcription initiation factor TFIID TATA-box-binding protein
MTDPMKLRMEDKRYDSLKIENIVASGAIADKIDLEIISKNIENCELNTKRFPGAVYRIDNPKIAALIFSSGKVVLTGIRDNPSLIKGLALIIGKMREVGIECYDEPKVVVTNIVCSYDIGNKINLNKVVMTLNLENIEYEPEQFPGLVYRISEPKIVALLFSSGKIILTGGKNMEDIKRGLDFLETKLGNIM